MHGFLRYALTLFAIAATAFGLGRPAAAQGPSPVVSSVATVVHGGPVTDALALPRVVPPPRRLHASTDHILNVSEAGAGPACRANRAAGLAYGADFIGPDPTCRHPLRLARPGGRETSHCWTNGRASEDRPGARRGRSTDITAIDREQASDPVLAGGSCCAQGYPYTGDARSSLFRDGTGTVSAGGRRRASRRHEIARPGGCLAVVSRSASGLI
jgi:hypothetical protein